MVPARDYEKLYKALEKRDALKIWKILEEMSDRELEIYPHYIIQKLKEERLEKISQLERDAMGVGREVSFVII